MKKTKRAPNKINSRRPAAGYVIIKISKIILKEAREKQSVTYKGNP